MHQSMARLSRLRISAVPALEVDRAHHHHRSQERFRLLRIIFILCIVVWTFGPSRLASANSFVRFDYNFELNSRARDTVFFELFDDRPLTTNNFLQYVNADLYDGSLVHRLARNFVVQGGGFYPAFISEPPPLNLSLDPNMRVDLDGNPVTPNPTIPNEFANPPVRSNVRGTIAMAKVGGQPNSATNQWFVNLANNGGGGSGLDTQNGGFTVFGHVLGDGMALFDAINTFEIRNLNPDLNNNGVRDGGPFGSTANDGVPTFGNSVVVVQDAERIDYFGAGTTTNIAAELNFSERDAFIDAGAVFVGSGHFVIGENRMLGVRESIPLNHSVVNRGTLSPGLQLGSIKMPAYEQSAQGTLDIQIGGAAADIQYDQLFVENAAQLDGALKVSLLNDFSPALGQSFTVISAGSIVGTFDDIQLPPLGAGLTWNTDVSATQVRLSVVAVPEPRTFMLILASASALAFYRARLVRRRFPS